MPKQKAGSPLLYDDSNRLIGVRDADGTESFSFAPRMTFAAMKALTGMVDGQLVFVTSYPANKGSNWRYSGVLADWFPVAPCLVYENTALASGVAQAAAQILLAMPMEAGLLAGKRFRMLVTWAKSGGTDTLTPTVRMGSAGTTADATVASPATLTGTNRSIGNEMWFRMASATSVERLGGVAGAAWNATNTSGVAFAAVTVASVAAANYLSLACTMGGTTDTPQVGYVAVDVLP